MISLVFFFWMFVALFAIIGAMRGWAKELLVSFSVILSLAFTKMLEQYVPFIRENFVKPALDPIVTTPTDAGTSLFWIRFSILFVLVFFGYQTVNLSKLLSGKSARERLQDFLLGFMIGAINGYLVVGSLWFYLFEAHYPFPFILDPTTINLPITQTLVETAEKLLVVMPPHVLGVPGIYFAVVIAFIFIIVVYI